MSSKGNVLSIDQITAKDGAPVWQVVTDFAERGPDGLVSSAFWLPRPGPVPAIGQEVAWGNALFKGAWAMWDGHRYPRHGLAFDPNSTLLYTG